METSVSSKKDQHEANLKNAGLDDLQFKDLPVIELEPFLECIKDGEANITPEAFNECLKVV